MEGSPEKAPSQLQPGDSLAATVYIRPICLLSTTEQKPQAIREKTSASWQKYTAARGRQQRGQRSSTKGRRATICTGPSTTPEGGQESWWRSQPETRVTLSETGLITSVNAASSTHHHHDDKLKERDSEIQLGELQGTVFGEKHKTKTQS